jgi:ribulose-5-phosphate 4-epimerase/fuculose-1-phosphate aldolase
MHLDDLRHDVALANRIAHVAGLVTAFGHISARIPDAPNTFLFPTRASPALADKSRLLVLDVDGTRREGDGEPNTEFWIHARIYAARPDVLAVVHVHSPACIALGQIGQALLPLHNHGALFAAGVPLFEPIGLIRTRELGDQVAATLGLRRAMFLRGHGANVAEADVRRATMGACFLEEAAALQLRALAAAGGRTDALRVFAPDENARLLEQLDAGGPMNRAWEYYAALADGRVAPSRQS